MVLKTNMLLTKINPFTSEEVTLELPFTEDEYNAYLQSGKNVQDYFPLLSTDLAEFVISGIPPDSWDVYLNETSTEELEVDFIYEDELEDPLQEEDI